MKKFVVFILMIGLISCASLTTVFDYDREADFSQYKTYSLTKDNLETVVGNFNRDRIISALEDELLAKGLTKAEDADLLVNAHIKAEDKIEASAETEGGYGSYNWHPGSTSTSINYEEYTQGTLFITMADASTNIIIWQGAASKMIEESASAEKRENSINAAVEQILLNYPPEK